MIFRNIKIDDYKDIIVLLKQLTKCSYDKHSFEKYIDNLPNNQHHFVLEKEGKLIASGVLVIESKIIHNFRNVGHIEDIVVNKNYRGLGLGKKIIQYIISFAEKKDCYKVILNCDPKIQSFYESCDFKKYNIQMGKYL